MPTPARATATAGSLADIAINALREGDPADRLTEGEVNKFLSSSERGKIAGALQPTDTLDGGSF